MKFDTNTLKPMPVSPEHCFLRPNPFIPPRDGDDAEDSKSDDASSSPAPSATTGRQVFYEATLVLTPVLASARVHERQAAAGRKQLLDAADVERLGQTLEGLYVTEPAAAAPATTTTTAPPPAVPSGAGVSPVTRLTARAATRTVATKPAAAAGPGKVCGCAQCGALASDSSAKAAAKCDPHLIPARP